MKLQVLLGVLGAVSTVLGAVSKGAEKSKVCANSLNQDDLSFTGFKFEMVLNPIPLSEVDKIGEDKRFSFNLHLCSNGYISSTIVTYFYERLNSKDLTTLVPFNKTLSLRTGEGIDTKAIHLKMARNKRSSTMPILAQNKQDGSIGGIFGSIDGSLSNSTDIESYFPVAELFFDPHLSWVEKTSDNLSFTHFPIYTGILGISESPQKAVTNLNGHTLRFNPNWYESVSVTETYDFTKDERDFSAKVKDELAKATFTILQKTYRGLFRFHKHQIDKYQGVKQSSKQRLFSKVSGMFKSSTSNDFDPKNSGTLELEALVLSKLGPKKSVNAYSEAAQKAFSQLAFPEQVFKYNKSEKILKLIGIK
ncbi:putative secreted protein [Wickerhamomyces ciferrii]|uniref:Secreted protein n=1 Tax=Wickerhamomyces ciferrii (strain ATCC 14091 / BCRC 22168 / CBS 111 / JCM 3599 / NBRC 0793 / NRRL Y-1031 F-60-10) TaxID=1206466 RepID=K0KEM6_WICCF|nr:uncharacterized protein BN7_211 [Wickerhamomyces ciferrii]CCH40677.1 putative secreted protein [Wickerhamomyces ciferrii]